MLLKLKSLKHVEIVSVEGRLDGRGSDEFETILKGLTERGRRKIVIDCSKLEYIDSGALRTLVNTLKETKRGNGNVVLCKVGTRIADTLKLVGFLSLFDNYDDLLEAVDAF